MDKLIILVKYAFLGALQGFTEPIPISSSGHLVIVEKLIGIHLPGLSFEVLMNTASLLAVLVIYRDDLTRLIGHSFQYILFKRGSDKNDFLFIIFLIIGTIPAGIIGILFKDMIEKNLKTITVVGTMLIFTGIALWLIRNLRGHKGDADLSIREAVIVGVAQAIALIPGVSRSGSTIVAAMGMGMKQETALKFSFLLYIPVSLGGIGLSIQDLLSDPNMQQLFPPYTISFLFSFIASYYSLRWFKNVMAKGNLKYFSIYCFFVGLFILMFV